MAGPYYVKPASLGGSDSADGLTLATAWANIAKLNTESASFASDTTVYIYGYKATPLYMDAQLIVRGNMRAIGVGDVTLWMKDKNGTLWQTSTTAADLRPYKVLAGPFTQPDSSGAPNCWQTSDTESTAVLYRLAGWASSDQTQPLVYLDHNTSNTASTISGAANSFNTNGTNLRFYSTTDPNTNGVTYVRSQPAAMTVGGSLAAVKLIGANPRLENVAVGGVAAVANTAQTLTAGYAVYVIQETDSTPSLTDVFAYHGSNHTIGAVAAASCDDAVITWRNVRWEQVPNWSGVSATVQVLFFNGGTGNTFHGYNVWSEKSLGLVNSAAGTNVYAATSFFMHNAGTGEVELDEVTLDGAYFGDLYIANNAMTTSLTVDNAGLLAVRHRATSTWTGCYFRGYLPSPQTSGITTTIRHSLIKPTGVSVSASSDRNQQGTLDIQFCAFDMDSVTDPGTFDNGYLIRSGTLNVTIANCLLKCRGTGLSGKVILNNYNLASDTVTLDRNIWASQVQVFVLKNSAATFTLSENLKTAGFEANSPTPHYYNTSTGYADIKVNSTYRPKSDSPLIGIAASSANTADYTGFPHATRNDSGMFEYNANPRRRVA